MGSGGVAGLEPESVILHTTQIAILLASLA